MPGKKKINIAMGIEALLENGFFYLKKQWKQSKENAQLVFGVRFYWRIINLVCFT